MKAFSAVTDDMVAKAVKVLTTRDGSRPGTIAVRAALEAAFDAAPVLLCPICGQPNGWHGTPCTSDDEAA